MDAVGCPRSDFKHLATGLAEPGGPMSAQPSDVGCRVVEAVLSGGGPWGFTLRGGREHREPLLITRVEEGSKASAAGLQVSDELVGINSVQLSGFRQEAICLVKSSLKTLTLTLRRRNDPTSRPHSWHSSKLAENQNETQKISQNAEPEPIWQSKYSISSSSRDVSKCWNPAKPQQTVSQLTAVRDMESVVPSVHTAPSGVTLPPSRHLSAVDLTSSGGGAVPPRKRESPHAHTLSTSSNHLDPSNSFLSKSQASSMECMFYRGVQNEVGSQPERPRYLQLPVGNGGRVSPRQEEQVQVCSRYSPSSATAGGAKANINPVWNVPETKKSAAPSPPPPPPPLRSDSFAATKVHEKGLSAPGAAHPGPEGPAADATAQPHQKAPQGHCAADKLLRGSEGLQKSLQPAVRSTLEPHQGPLAPQRGDTLHPSPYSRDPSTHPTHPSTNPTHPSKLSSLSSTDVRHGLAAPDHPRQHSDESSHLYLHAKASPTAVVAAPGGPKNQSMMGGYYRSLQELPTNTGSQGHTRTSTASLSSTALDQSCDRTRGGGGDGGGGGHGRYYCYTTPQQQQLATHPPMNTAAPAPPGCILGKLEAWRDEAENARLGSDRGQAGSQRVIMNKHLAGQQAHNGYGSEQASGHVTSENVWMARSSSDERDRRSGGGNNADGHHGNRYPPLSLQSHREPLVAPDPWVSLDSRKICPQQAPLLCSLSQEQKLLSDRRSSPAATASAGPVGPNQECAELGGGSVGGSKQGRRSDRYATTLRNEILIKRAQLQKSRSAATLSCPGEVDDEPEAVAWRSAETSSDGSFSSTYKDHLKEAQARVLQATSFKRKDLELPGSEGVLPGCPLSAALASRDLSVGDILSSKTGAVFGGNHVSRIGSRKRFPASKRVHSFSEPDKINEVGVEDKGLSLESVGSFIDRRMFFEGAAKPAFSKPAPKHSARILPEEHTVGGKVKGSSSPQDHLRDVPSKHHSGKEYSWPKQDPLHQLLTAEEHPPRLGTFAEYEASWSMQRKHEAKSSGRYRSAENILEPSAEDRSLSACIHERSRSSPSADFHEQKIPLPARKLHPDCPGEAHAIGVLAERGLTERRGFREHDHYPSAPAESQTDSEKGDARPHQPMPEPPPYPEHLRHIGVTATPEHLGLPKTRSVALPQRLSPPRLDASTQRESSDAQATGHLERGSRSTCVGLALPVPSVGSEASPRGSPCPERLEEEWRALHQTAVAALDTAVVPLPHHRHHLPRGPASSPAALTVSTSATRSTSPQCAPPRLTDQPPVPTQDELARDKMAVVSELSNTGKRVPVKIVHAETSLERNGRQYLLSNGAQGALSTTTTTTAATPQPSFSCQEPSYSPFCSYSRHQEETVEEEREAHRGSSPPQGAPQGICSAPVEVTLNGQPRRGSGGLVEARDRWDEEVKREELARDIMGKDKSLADILDQSRMWTTMDLMGGIYPQGEQALEGAQQRRRAVPKQTSPRASDHRRVEDDLAAAVSVVSSSSYYSTSAPKAELLIKMKDMQEQMDEQDSEDELDYDLSSKKQELISSLSKKLQVLHEARESLQEDVQENNTLGEEVEGTVQAVCKPNELDKFRMFIGDLDKVVSLLLSLSGRLARVENALNNLEEGASPEEKHALTEKRQLLIGQHEDAKELKENLDRRERLVYDILATYLSAERLADYEHFVKMKSALIIEQRKLEDKIKLGEEQLKCLRESLPLEQRPTF